MWRRAISNRTSEAQFNLGAGTRAAPNGQLSADLSGTFPHSGEAEMSRPPLFPDFSWNAVTIISNSQAKLLWFVADLSFNMAGIGVLESIAQRLARDPVKLVPYDRVQVPWWSFHGQTKDPVIVGRQFIPHRVHGFRKVVGSCCRQAQVV